MAKKKVVVLDYGSGNVRSAVRALEAAGAEVELTADADKVQAADGLVVPGVGAYASVMDQLTKLGALRWIGRRIAGGKPVLGICVGHQVFFDEGVEHGVKTAGIGEWPGTVERLQADVIPHMGWNTVRPPENTKLFAGIENERFYFVHSYGVQKWEFDVTQPAMTPPQVTWSTHGTPFIAAVENGALSAVQFHPEKSGEAGKKLLSNWLETL
ncbi:imidazole glycerol phosphate synthase subunit HisH [Glutamicibacter soli]|uniref:Imidazole glycerol phosphate synthase subunit HisH n=1 Tax=Glutamicibacter soli TaxID=453836 RepID=A0A365YJ42_9MICC|nr:MULTISPECIES: imidazole glycerol phosphate synthase subunit HisH [Micrococcaceae]ALD63441.1 glutamine amidotransferase [Arthrobacter sp. LS16]ALQ31313.1 imidazole glycerol phosphate synthase subunit HisH [Arthrobacter sp. YC-RL1]KLI87414.1 glutamine amidotransferase [Arthrobacter sp. YC-RL1]NAZ17098.1 imidazole glycerol phosphate synthase subunit HisH [Glutamicibacter soli]RBM02559.1 imidazole glycerol phosphate synthase subunit HisH [Glutamicibacter soli]